MIQAIRVETGVRIVESNARVGGASSLAMTADLDSRFWFVLASLGEDLDDHPLPVDLMPSYGNDGTPVIS